MLPTSCPCSCTFSLPMIHRQTLMLRCRLDQLEQLRDLLVLGTLPWAWFWFQTFTFHCHTPLPICLPCSYPHLRWISTVQVQTTLVRRCKSYKCFLKPPTLLVQNCKEALRCWHPSYHWLPVPLLLPGLHCLALTSICWWIPDDQMQIMPVEEGRTLLDQRPW